VYITNFALFSDFVCIVFMFIRDEIIVPLHIADFFCTNSIAYIIISTVWTLISLESSHFNEYGVLNTIMSIVTFNTMFINNCQFKHNNDYSHNTMSVNSCQFKYNNDYSHIQYNVDK